MLKASGCLLARVLRPHPSNHFYVHAMHDIVCAHINAITYVAASWRLYNRRNEAVAV